MQTPPTSSPSNSPKIERTNEQQNNKINQNEQNTGSLQTENGSREVKKLTNEVQELKTLINEIKNTTEKTEKNLEKNTELTENTKNELTENTKLSKKAQEASEKTNQKLEETTTEKTVVKEKKKTPLLDKVDIEKDSSATIKKQIEDNLKAQLNEDADDTAKVLAEVDKAFNDPKKEKFNQPELEIAVKSELKKKWLEFSLGIKQGLKKEELAKSLSIEPKELDSKLEAELKKMFKDVMKNSFKQSLGGKIDSKSPVMDLIDTQLDNMLDDYELVRTVRRNLPNNGIWTFSFGFAGFAASSYKFTAPVTAMFTGLMTQAGTYLSQYEVLKGILTATTKNQDLLLNLAFALLLAIVGFLFDLWRETANPKTEVIKKNDLTKKFVKV